MNDAKHGRSTGGEKQTLVEEGTEFKGTLCSNCPIVINGRLEGDISGPSLHVSASGSVSGVVKAGEIRSEGEIAGQYEADVVRLAGRVKDRTVIRAKSLEIRLAPQKGRLEVTFGECDLQVGDEPTKEAALPAEGAPGHVFSSTPALPGLTEPAAPLSAKSELSGKTELSAKTDGKPGKSANDTRTPSQTRT